MEKQVNKMKNYTGGMDSAKFWEFKKRLDKKSKGEELALTMTDKNGVKKTEVEHRSSKTQIVKIKRKN